MEGLHIQMLMTNQISDAILWSRVYLKKDFFNNHILLTKKNSKKSYAIKAFSDNLSSRLKGVLDTWSESKLTTVK